MLPGPLVLRMILFPRSGFTVHCSLRLLVNHYLFCCHLVLFHPTAGGLSRSGHSIPEFSVLPSVHGETLSFIHLCLGVPGFAQSQWKHKKSNLELQSQGSIYDMSGKTKIKKAKISPSFLFWWRSNRRHRHPSGSKLEDIPGYQGLQILWPYWQL